MSDDNPDEEPRPPLPLERQPPPPKRTALYLIRPTARDALLLSTARDQIMGYPRQAGRSSRQSRKSHLAQTLRWRNNIKHPTLDLWAVAFDGAAIRCDGQSTRVDGSTITIDLGSAALLPSEWFEAT